MSNREENHSHDEIMQLVSQAKHRPLPRSTKALAVIVMVGLIFTGGIAYGKHRATASTGTGLSLSALSGGGFGAGFGGGAFRNRGGSASATSGTLSGGTVSGGGFGTGAATTTDVAGTIVSVTPTTVVIQTLAGEKQTFPLLTNTRVRESTAGTLAGVKPGDIVTIKPDSSNNATTITVVK